jgi:RNA polymerase sigma-70 factor (ECF subfamily)
MFNPQWNENEQLLIDEFKNGNTEAFQYVYKLYATALRGFANTLIKNSQESEDIVTESFIKLWKQHQDFNTISHLRAFLYTVVRNACMDFMKNSTRRKNLLKGLSYSSVPDEEDQFRADIIKAEVFNKIMEEVEKMPEGMRNVFMMLYVHKMSSAEVAQKLNITRETVRVQKGNVIKQLKKILGEDKFLTGCLLFGISLVEFMNAPTFLK